MGENGEGDGMRRSRAPSRSAACGLIARLVDQVNHRQKPRHEQDEREYAGNEGEDGLDDPAQAPHGDVAVCAGQAAAGVEHAPGRVTRAVRVTERTGWIFPKSALRCTLFDSMHGSDYRKRDTLLGFGTASCTVFAGRIWGKEPDHRLRIPQTHGKSCP